MPDQTLINVFFAIICGGLGWMLNSLWQATKDLQNTDKQIVDRISAVEVLVAGKYVTREELVEISRNIDHKLDQIQTTLNSKADK